MKGSVYIPPLLNQEVEKVSNIIERISVMPEAEFISIFNEIKKKQAFLMHTFLNFAPKISKEQLNFLSNDLVIIWLYFKDEPNAQRIPISVENYLYFYRKNLELLDDVSNQLIDSEIDFVVNFGQNDCKSLALISMFAYRFHGLKEMKNLNPELQADIILSVKSLIQCLEQLVRIEH